MRPVDKLVTDAQGLCVPVASLQRDRPHFTFGSISGPTGNDRSAVLAGEVDAERKRAFATEVRLDTPSPPLTPELLASPTTATLIKGDRENGWAEFFAW